MAKLQNVFVRRVREELERRQWTQAELARRMGVAPPYVGDYLLMRKSPGLKVIEKFARALEVAPAALLQEVTAARRSRRKSPAEVAG